MASQRASAIQAGLLQIGRNGNLIQRHHSPDGDTYYEDRQLQRTVACPQAHSAASDKTKHHMTRPLCYTCGRDTSHLTDLRDDRTATTDSHSDEQLFIHPDGPRCCLAPQHAGMGCDTRGATYRVLGVDGSSDNRKLNACAMQARQGVKSWVHIFSFIRVYLLQVAGSDPVECPRLSYQSRPTLTTWVVIPTLQTTHEPSCQARL